MTPEKQSELERWSTAHGCALEAIDTITHAGNEIGGEASLSDAITALAEFIVTANEKLEELRGNQTTP